MMESIGRRLIQVCVIIGTVFALAAGEATVTISTTSGSVQGFTKILNRSFKSRSVNTFLGIPFAEPPLGLNRFRAPVEVAKWQGTKQARTLPNTCMQSIDTSFDRFKGVDMWNPNTNISEDCLYLNIWVPESDGSSQLCTMVWIYGGAYVSGSSTLTIYDGTLLAAKKNVIVASMQYRLGVFGFLYSGTEEAPGNMGLLDQQMAMKWIYENIESFGGDKTKITLMGESAGAGSVSHHLLAESSWPYFTNAIILSGSSLAPWASENTTVALGRFEAFAERLDCDKGNTDDVIKCLTSKDEKEVELNQYVTGGVEFKPVSGTAFLTDVPSKLLESGRVKTADILIGNTKDEGEYFLPYHYPGIYTEPRLWQTPTLSREEYTEVVRDLGDGLDDLVTGILHTYEFSKLPSERGSYTDRLDNIFGDTWFKCPVHDFATHFSDLDPKKDRTYVYSFEYRHSANPWPGWMGVLHGYEIEMVFGMPFDPDLDYSHDDRAVSERLMDYLVTFAESGSPSSAHSLQTSWPPFTSGTERHMVFNQDTTNEVRQGYRRAECSFWKHVAPLLTENTANKDGTSSSTREAASSILVIFICTVAARIALVRG